jgi:hypothetical protein
MKRHARIAVGLALSVLASLITLIAAAEPAVAVAPPPSPVLHIGMSNPYAMVVVGTKVYVSLEAGTHASTPDTVAVLNADGTLDSKLEAIPGARGLAVSGTTLYVAASEAASIWRFDTTTDPPTKLGETSIAPMAWPLNLVVTNGRLWFGACTSTWEGRIGSMALDGTDVQAVLPIDPVAEFHYWEYCPDLDAGAGAPGRLFIAPEGLSPSHLEIYDVSVEPPTFTTDDPAWPHGYFYGSDIEPLTGGANFAVTTIPQGNHGMDVRKISDYGLVLHYDAPGVTPSGIVHTDAHGGLLAALFNGTGSGVSVWNTGTSTPRVVFQLPVIYHGGIAFSGDGSTLYALSTVDSKLAIYVLDPLAVGSTLTLDTPVSPVAPGTQVTVSGTLGFDDASSASSQTVTLKRKDRFGRVTTVGQQTTAVDGSFTFTDEADVSGLNTYTASFAGSGSVLSSTDQVAVQVKFLKAPTSVNVSAHQVVIGKSVVVTGHLGSGPVPRQLRILARPVGGSLKVLKSGHVDAKGNLRVTFTPNRTTYFLVRYDESDLYRRTDVTTKTAVRTITQASAIDYFATSGPYRLYHYGSPAKVQIHVIPDHTGAYALAVLQGFISGAWRQVDDASFRLRSGSKVVVFIVGRKNVGLRFRATMRQHPDHLGSNSAWVYLKFV